MTNSTRAQLVETMRRLAPGFYTERDDGPWYVATPSHQLLADSFVNHDDAYRLVCWLAGGEAPKGWTATPRGDGELLFEIAIPGRPTATLWTAEAKLFFPDWIERMKAATTEVEAALPMRP